MRQKYQLYGVKRIGYFDIEVDNLDPEFGHILTMSLLIREVVPHERIVKQLNYRIKKEDIDSATRKRHSDFDHRIIEQFLLDLKKYEIDMIIVHYGVGWNKMDIPFLRGRAFLCKLEKLLPPHKTIRYGDTWKMGHIGVKSHSYRLESLSYVLKIATHKTDILPTIWNLAKQGDARALDYIMDHNIKDVKITYQVHKKLENFFAIPQTYV